MESMLGICAGKLGGLKEAEFGWDCCTVGHSCAVTGCSSRVAQSEQTGGGIASGGLMEGRGLIVT